MAINSLSVTKVLTGIYEALDKKYGANLYNLTYISINSPCSAEDNFLSEIYAISLKVKRINDNFISSDEEETNYIGKSQLVRPDSKNDLSCYAFNLIFTKEMLLYTTILQRMEIFSRQIGENFPILSPKLHHYYTEGDEYSCLFMENLKMEGFYIPETHGKGMKVDECASIMKAIARFHALSLVIESQDGSPLSEKHEICSAEFFCGDMMAKDVSPIVHGSYEGRIQLAEKYRPDLVSLMETFHGEKSIWDRLCALVKPGATSFNCLCHGDARLNNIFIDKKDIRSVRFIDFQMTRYASPMTDLQYIFHVAATKEFREKNTEQMLLTYYEEFKRVLSKFPSVNLLPAQEEAVQEWTFDKLKEEYESMTLYGFLISTTLLPIILLRPGDIKKSVGQMGKEERERFWVSGRKDMVFDIGCKHADLRERLFDICDEAFLFTETTK